MLQDPETSKLAELVDELTRKTYDGAISWRRTDRAGTFLFSGERGAVRLEELGAALGSGPIQITVLDGNNKERIVHATPRFFVSGTVDRNLVNSTTPSRRRQPRTPRSWTTCSARSGRARPSSDRWRS